MRIAPLVYALLGTTLLTGCGALTGERTLARLNQTEPTGSPFTQALSREYRAFANSEWKDMNDWPDGSYFAEKGLRAAQGTVVPPEEVQDRRIPTDIRGEMANARARLIAAFDAGARERNPEQAAIAQARFDCWMEQQEENWQVQDIARCRNEFNQALAALEGAPAPAAVRPQPGAVLVFFDYNATDITANGQRVVAEAAAAARSAPNATVVVAGHTDTTGSPQYNQTLSMRRANTVRDALVAAGIPANRIVSEARGESQPLVPTGDGVREPSNRRAEIRLRL